MRNAPVARRHPLSSLKIDGAGADPSDGVSGTAGRLHEDESAVAAAARPGGTRLARLRKWLLGGWCFWGIWGFPRRRGGRRHRPAVGSSPGRSTAPRYHIGEALALASAAISKKFITSATSYTYPTRGLHWICIIQGRTNGRSAAPSPDPRLISGSWQVQEAGRPLHDRLDDVGSRAVTMGRSPISSLAAAISTRRCASRRVAPDRLGEHRGPCARQRGYLEEIHNVGHVLHLSYLRGLHWICIIQGENEWTKRCAVA
jgi:hypothetical protein